MSESFEFDEVQTFTAGTVGPQGQREFFLQVHQLGHVISFRIEKQQVAALAEYLAAVVTEGAEEPAAEPAGQFVEPQGAEWTIGSIGAAYEDDTDRFVILCEELTGEELTGEEADPATLRVRMSRTQVAGFVDHARELVSAGRPPCPYCGRPLDGDGSFCPCAN